MSDHPDTFDARVRQLHAHALVTLSPSTLARLREARHAPSQPRRHPAWLLATACSTLLAIGMGLHLYIGHGQGQGQTQKLTTATATDDDTMDQNPDLYVWLSSENALAME